MKYILMMNTPERGPYSIFNWPRKDFEAHIAYLKSFNKELENLGEFVAVEALTGPDQAKLVRAGKDGKPVTDGVFPESKEFLAGYWIVDVDSPSERMRSPPKRRRRPGRAGAPSRHGDRSAPGDERPPDDLSVMPSSLDTRCEHLLRELAPQVLGAVVRRFRDFAAAEDAVQEALIAAASQWPRDGIPDSPRAWLIQVRFAAHDRSRAQRDGSAPQREAAAAMETDHLARRSR